MIISGIQAQGLFINLEELVQVSLAFEADLKDLVAELDAAGPDAMPAQFGDMILHHVRQMYPFKKWLASYDFARMLYDSLTTGKSKNVQFVKFVERMQISFRESAQTTAGFSELLAEPFQRIARYSMMIDRALISRLHALIISDTLLKQSFVTCRRTAKMSSRSRPPRAC